MTVFSTQAELLEEDARRVPTLRLKAKRIVVLDGDEGMSTFVCFEFRKSDALMAAATMSRGQNVEIHLEDSNGEFVNYRKYYIHEVEVPNQGNPLGGAADVLIIKAEKQ
jgi:hypothetical protein